MWENNLKSYFCLHLYAFPRYLKKGRILFLDGSLQNREEVKEKQEFLKVLVVNRHMILLLL